MKRGRKATQVKERTGVRLRSLRTRGGNYPQIVTVSHDIERLQSS